jgi:hypothetical protein
MLPPHSEFLSSRQLARGSRSLPRTTLRVQDAGGEIAVVSFTGEMDGPVSQGDEVVVYGYLRSPRVLTASEIWLVGYVSPDGSPTLVEPPLRIAKKRTLT